MQPKDIVRTLIPRAQQLRLIDPQTGYVDTDELTGYVQEAVRFLANTYQLPLFLVLNRELFRTAPLTDSYALPTHFSLWIPTATTRAGRVERQASGVALTKVDGSGLVPLGYIDPAEFLVQVVSTTPPVIPQLFTVTGNIMTLSPIPDTIYIIQALERSVTGDLFDIPERAVAAVSIEALYRIASDRRRDVMMLREERMQLTSALVNDAARLRQSAAKQRDERDWAKYWYSSR